jgi:hypothetical protein
MEYCNYANDLQCQVEPSASGFLAVLRHLDVGEILDRVWFPTEAEAHNYASRAVMGWVD